MKQQLKILRWSNVWVVFTILCGFADVIFAATSSALAPVFVVIPALTVGILFWKIVELELELARDANTVNNLDTLTTLFLLIVIAAYIVAILLELFLAPSSAWDLLDFWAPLTNEISGFRSENIADRSHQPLLLASNLSVWGVTLKAFEDFPPHIGPVIFWALLLLAICAMAYLVVRLAGASANKGLLVLVLLLSIPLYENHVALFGYTELLSSAFILAIFGNVIAYRITRNFGWLVMALLCALGLAFTRNTGILFAVVALLPLLILGFRKSVLLVVTACTVLTAVTLASALTEEPPNLTFRDGVLQGDIPACPDGSVKFLYVRVYGVGNQYDSVRDSVFLNTRVISQIESGRTVFKLPSDIASPDTVWSTRVQCKGKTGAYFRAIKTHFIPVAERKLVLSENVEFHLGYNRIVVAVAGRIIRIDGSLYGLSDTITTTLFKNSSFGMVPCFLLLALILVIKENSSKAKIPFLSWWGAYLGICLMLTLAIYVVLYGFLPYFRHNAATNMDTVGSRTLMPLLVPVFVGCAAWVASFTEPKIANGQD